MKGILFKPEMIQAIVEGRKTQTRRVMKFPPPSYCDTAELLITGTWNFYKGDDPDFSAYLKNKHKPKYSVGEVVYIKEAFWYPPSHNYNRNIVAYRLIVAESCGEEAAIKSIWKSPMMMPEWASRYHIQILDIKPQRLQEITEAGAVEEGCPMIEASCGLRLQWYRDLWDSINKDYPWSSNPWIWLYNFKLVGR